MIACLIGHYGVALAAKRLAPGKSLGWNFIAVQFLDILWAPAILAGIEHVRIVPGLMILLACFLSSLKQAIFMDPRLRT